MSVAPSIVRINGKQINYTSKINISNISDLSVTESLDEAASEGMKMLIKPSKNKNTLRMSLWSTSGIMLYQADAMVKNPSMWKEIIPVFNVFQEIGMVMGALAILAGLIIMMFKKKLGWMIISTAGLVILGCFLVPSAVMLVAIIGKLLNGALTNAFDSFY